MKVLFSILFLFFYPLSSQSQAGILVENSAHLDQFDWSAFSNKANIKENIAYRNKLFSRVGAIPFTVSTINFDKKQLTQLEQELTLYNQKIKTGLSPREIKAAEEAIGNYWETIKNIEDQIQIHAGLKTSVETFGDIQMSPRIGDAKAYRDGVWELYKADHNVLLNLIDKKDESLYKLLGEDDEAYAKLISPFATSYIGKIEATAQAYYNSWQSTYVSKPNFRISDDMAILSVMYENSFEVSNCFNKNFKNSTGNHQQDLMRTIQGWHTEQGLLGSEVFINAYKNDAFSPNVAIGAIGELNVFGKAPDVVKKKIGAFYRKEILNNEDFINTQDEASIIARIRSLIGLKYFDLLNEEEEKIFNEAIEKGIIRIVNPKIKNPKFQNLTFSSQPSFSPDFKNLPSFDR